MMTMNTLLSRNVAVGVVAAVAAGTILLAGAAGDDRDGSTKVDTSLIANLKAKDARTREQAVQALLQARKETVDELVVLVAQSDGQKYSNETRSMAAYLLGIMRAEEVVPALSKALAGPIFWRELILDISPYDFPVFTALVRIGRPAVPAMIANVEQTDDENLRLRSLDVLAVVLGGKKHLLELLGKLQARAEDKAVAKRIEVAAAFSQEHYKETEEPLY
jgi:HEAT repeat protein